mmetsp:Transcript_62816/g.183695  ORF Transcript_62816/g.183695 Transcript_62816/m.183695 type:complete len:501 (+) Transcript_62816:133-1635(+)
MQRQLVAMMGRAPHPWLLTPSEDDVLKSGEIRGLLSNTLTTSIDSPRRTCSASSSVCLTDVTTTDFRQHLANCRAIPGPFLHNLLQEIVHSVEVDSCKVVDSVQHATSPLKETTVLNHLCLQECGVCSLGAEVCENNGPIRISTLQFPGGGLDPADIGGHSSIVALRICHPSIECENVDVVLGTLLAAFRAGSEESCKLIEHLLSLESWARHPHSDLASQCQLWEPLVNVSLPHLSGPHFASREPLGTTQAVSKLACVATRLVHICPWVVPQENYARRHITPERVLAEAKVFIGHCKRAGVFAIQLLAEDVRRAVGAERVQVHQVPFAEAGIGGDAAEAVDEPSCSRYLEDRLRCRPPLDAALLRGPGLLAQGALAVLGSMASPRDRARAGHCHAEQDEYGSAGVGLLGVLPPSERPGPAARDDHLLRSQHGLGLRVALQRHPLRPAFGVLVRCSTLAVMAVCSVGGTLLRMAVQKSTVRRQAISNVRHAHPAIPMQRAR